ncbi:MAG TPA: carbohydrate ABC transporter permease [Thermomicrobiales bacterium]|nr:carbohydrate ABC transporter permease [Thermomicrobiales bacterium]
MGVTARKSEGLQPESTVAAPRREPVRRAGIWKRRAGRVYQELAPLLIVLLFIFPFLILVSTSFKPEEKVFSLPPRIWSDVWTLDNYRRVFEVMPFWRYLGNTTLIAVLSVAGTLFSSPFVAYSLAKLKWRGRDAMFLLILATMMLPPQVTMVPVFIMWNSTPFMGTYVPLIVPAFLGNAFFIFMLRQFFRAIPNDLLDAARIDGANELRIYFQIVMPMARAALATVGLFAFVWAWVDFLNPLIYLSDPDMYTLSIGLYAFFSQHGIEWGPLMAACAIFSIPLVIVFIVTQKQLIEGISLTGLK